VVVFPTPPFWFATAMIFPTRAKVARLADLPEGCGKLNP
jgi:hypothetical protein